MKSLDGLSKVVLILLVSLLLSGCASSVPQSTVSPNKSGTAVDLLPDPGMHNPVLQFGDGGVANNEGTVFPGTSPTMGYTDYGWWVTQWGKYSSDDPPIPYYLTPTSYVQNDPSTLDPNFGVAPLIFYSENDPTISHVALYQDSVLNNWVYELWAQDGLLTAGGGTDLFLANDTGTPFPALDPGSATLDADVRLTFATKVKARTLSYNDQAAMTDGSVLAQYFSGMSLWYTDPATGIPYGQFLQIAHANTAENTAADLVCMGVENGVPSVQWNGVLPGDEFLSSTPSTGGLQTMEFDVNKYVCSLVQAVYNCAGVGGGTNVGFPPAAFDLKNWQIIGFYIGLETENRMVPNDQTVRGHAGLGVQIEDLHLYKFPATKGPSCTK